MEDHNLNTIEKQVALTSSMDSEIPQNPVMDIEWQLKNLLQNCQNIKQSEELLLRSISDINKSFEEIKPVLKIWGKYKNRLLEIMVSEESTEEAIKRYYDYPEIQKALKENQEVLHKKEEELQTWSNSSLNQKLVSEKENREECQRKLAETLDNLQKAIQDKSSAEEKHRQLQVEIERLQEANKRLSNENASINEQLKTAIEKNEDKSEIILHLQEDLNVYKSYRGLVADVFKIDANSEKEFSLALQTTKKILFACAEYTRNKQFDIQESLEDLIKDFNKLQTLIIDNKRLKDELTSNQMKIKEQDSKLYDYELKNKRQMEELESRDREIENKENAIKKIKENDELVNKKCQELVNKTTLCSRIISIFTSIDNDLETRVNDILNNGNKYENLNFISDFVKQIVEKYNRLVEIDKVTEQHEIPELSALSLPQILSKYSEYDVIKQNHDLYEHFIKDLFILQGNSHIISLDHEQKNNALNSFIHDYGRILALCHYFDASGETGGIVLDGWESHQAQMNQCIEEFYQSVGQLINFSENTGVTAFDKITALPFVQKKINQSMEAAIFSINFSRKEVEESNSMQKYCT